MIKQASAEGREPFLDLGGRVSDSYFGWDVGYYVSLDLYGSGLTPEKNGLKYEALSTNGLKATINSNVAVGDWSASSGHSTSEISLFAYTRTKDSLWEYIKNNMSKKFKECRFYAGNFLLIRFTYTSGLNVLPNSDYNGDDRVDISGSFSLYPSKARSNTDFTGLSQTTTANTFYISLFKEMNGAFE